MEMYTGELQILAKRKTAFTEENTNLANQVMQKDKALKKKHMKTDKEILDNIQINPAIFG